MKVINFLLAHIQIIIIFIIVGTMLSLCSYEIATENSPENIAKREARHTLSLSSNLSEIEYVYDKTTDLCFAYWWGGSGNGGPALANVPCENLDNLIEFTSK